MNVNDLFASTCLDFVPVGLQRCLCAGLPDAVLLSPNIVLLASALALRISVQVAKTWKLKAVHLNMQVLTEK